MSEKNNIVWDKNERWPHLNRLSNISSDQKNNLSKLLNYDVTWAQKNVYKAQKDTISNTRSRLFSFIPDGFLDNLSFILA